MVNFIFDWVMFVVSVMVTLAKTKAPPKQTGCILVVIISIQDDVKRECYFEMPGS